MSGRLALFGKTPARGDFVARDMDPGLEDIWLDWMRSGLAAHVHGRLAEERHFLAGPTWAFAARSSAFDSAPLSGVVMPCKDSEGRCFPLARFAIHEGDAQVIETAAANTAWFASLAQGLTLLLPDPDMVLPAPPMWQDATEPGYAQAFGLDAADPNLTMMVAFLDNALDDVVSLWWSIEEDDVPLHVIVQTGPSDDELWQRLFLASHPSGAATGGVT